MKNAIVLVCLALGACGGKDQEQAAPTATPTKPKALNITCGQVISGQGVSFAYGRTVDAQGNVAVSGRIYNSSGLNDTATESYAASSAEATLAPITVGDWTINYNLATEFATVTNTSGHSSRYTCTGSYTN